MMASHSTREAARLLGVSMATINRYIVAETIPVPPLTQVGGVTVRLWSDKDIAKAKKIVAEFIDGRRTRHRKSKKSSVRAR
jgi:predicted site-specific integrase-resolvase